ncbi:MAG: efflux RND transporter periplasmic adaptor subunit, partial [Bradymonadaceae bacterium]
SNTNLTSPIAGIITATHFVAGEQFMAGAQTPSIVTVQQFDPLRVVINASERYFPVVKAGMAAQVRLDAYEDRAFEGRVERINPTIDADSRTFRVEIRIDNAEGLLSPGMSARVSLELGDVTGRFLPSAAVRTRPGSDETYVYVVEEDTARQVYLETGERIEEYYRILSGLPEDALVVVEGMSRLSEESPVRIAEETGP